VPYKGWGDYVDFSVYEMRLSNLELAIVGAASVVFIAGFFPWWGERVDPFGSLSVSGWSAGFTAWAGLLLLTAVGVLLVVFRWVGVSWRSRALGSSMLVAGLSLAGTALVFVRWLSLPSHVGNGLDYGARAGIYVALIACLVETAAVAVVWAWRHRRTQVEAPNGVPPPVVTKP
jgi:hypothetical protein